MAARLLFHNAESQRFTKGQIPFIIVLIEELPNREEALKREKQIKSWKGRNAFEMLIEGKSCHPYWNQVASI